MQKKKSPIAFVVIVVIALMVVGFWNLSEVSGRSFASIFKRDQAMKQVEAPSGEEAKASLAATLKRNVEGNQKDVMKMGPGEDMTEAQGVNPEVSTIIMPVPPFYTPSLNDAFTSTLWYDESSHHVKMSAQEDADRAKAAGEAGS